MLKRFLMVLLNAAALVLELLPFGMPLVLNGGAPDVVYKTESSYWAPFWLINVSAHFTLISTGILMVLVILFAFISNKKRHGSLLIFSLVTAVISTLAMIYSITQWIDAYTLVSVSVTLVLWTEFIVIRDFMKKTYGDIVVSGYKDK